VGWWLIRAHRKTTEVSLRLTIAEARAQVIRERKGTVERSGPYWALVDTNVREVVYFYDTLSEAAESLKRYATDGCIGCKLKRGNTLSDVLGWHEPFEGEDEIARRERGENLADYQRVQGYGA
jgi:hypothetical protein